MREETKETKKIQIVEEHLEESDRKHYSYKKQNPSRNQSADRTVEPSALSTYPHADKIDIFSGFTESRQRNSD